MKRDDGVYIQHSVKISNLIYRVIQFLNNEILETARDPKAILSKLDLTFLRSFLRVIIIKEDNIIK